MTGAAASNKEISEPGFLPPAGPGLWELIERQARLGSPAFTIVNGLKVPALKATAEWRNYNRNPLSRGVKGPVAAHLDGDREGAQRVLEAAHSRAQLRELSGAAYRDLGANSEGDIAEEFHSGKGDAERQARADISRGRALWISIGAWPWWSIAAVWQDKGADAPVWDFSIGLPGRWWELPRVIANFKSWRSG